MSSLLLVASGHASAATPTSVEIGNVAALIWTAVWGGEKTVIPDLFFCNSFSRTRMFYSALNFWERRVFFMEHQSELGVSSFVRTCDQSK
jgi:hypothetical protein